MMDSTKLFLLILYFSGVIFSAQAEDSTSDTRARDQTLRSLLQSAIPSSCNAETSVRWYDSPPSTEYRNLTSAGDCCQLCQQTPGCRAWVWRSIGRTCYLLFTVGDERICSRCTGGILDNEPLRDEDIDDFLQRCADQGGRAARAAATAACIVVTDTCAPAADDEEQPEVVASFLNGRVEDVVERSCDTVFAQTCRTESRNQASDISPECDAILDRGPRESREGCEDRAAARRLFNAQLEELCTPED